MLLGQDLNSIANVLNNLIDTVNAISINGIPSSILGLEIPTGSVNISSFKNDSYYVTSSELVYQYLTNVIQVLKTKNRRK